MTDCEHNLAQDIIGFDRSAQRKIGHYRKFRFLYKTHSSCFDDEEQYEERYGSKMSKI